jgi:transposase-like protein
MTRQIRQFTPDERTQALHRAEEVGATRAGKELGVARCTIHRWQREARRGWDSDRVRGGRGVATRSWGFTGA